MCTGAVFSWFAKPRKNGVLARQEGCTRNYFSSGIRVLAMCRIKFLRNLKSVTLALASRDSPACLSPSIPWVKEFLCLDNHERETKPAKNSILGIS